jgi:hypothetical protein
LTTALRPVIVAGVQVVLEDGVGMSEENDIQDKGLEPFPRKKVLRITVIAVALAIILFTVAAVLPGPERSLLKNPLRSILTGVGLLAVACPLCTIGLIIKRRSANSPYFEEGFIATVLNVFGFLCLLLGLICIGLGIYAFAKSALGAG